MGLFESLAFALLISTFTYPRYSSLMKVKFTKLECEERDVECCKFKRCELKALAHQRVGLYINLQLHKLPIHNVTIKAASFVKGNGYRPYLYNSTLEFCKFMKNPSRQMFWKLFFDMVKRYTNANHSCPYNHDVIVDGLILDEGMFKLFPLPSNYYMIDIKGILNGSVRAEVRAYFQIYD